MNDRSLFSEPAQGPFCDQAPRADCGCRHTQTPAVIYAVPPQNLAAPAGREIARSYRSGNNCGCPTVAATQPGSYAPEALLEPNVRYDYLDDAYGEVGAFWLDEQTETESPSAAINTPQMNLPDASIAPQPFPASPASTLPASTAPHTDFSALAEPNDAVTNEQPAAEQAESLAPAPPFALPVLEDSESATPAPGPLLENRKEAAKSEQTDFAVQTAIPEPLPQDNPPAAEVSVPIQSAAFSKTALSGAEFSITTAKKPFFETAAFPRSDSQTKPPAPAREVWRNG